MTLTPLELAPGPAVQTVRPRPVDRLPGSDGDDPFLRLAAGWLVGHPTNTATAYRRDLQAWARWCTHLDVHPLAAERHHVDAWVRHLTTQPQPRTGRPAAPASVARRLSALAGFYDYGVHDAQVLTHSPVASVRRPKVSDESQAIGLTADELRRLLTAAAAHSPRTAALVSLLTFCGLRISEALNAEIRDYGHDHGHRVLKITRKGGKTARVALAPVVVRALDAYLDGRTAGRIFASRDQTSPYGYRSAYDQLGRLCKTARACLQASPRTACATPTPPSHSASAPPSKTSKTPSATPTPAPPAATTAVGTTSTAPPTTFSLRPWLGRPPNAQPTLAPNFSTRVAVCSSLPGYRKSTSRADVEADWRSVCRWQ